MGGYSPVEAEYVFLSMKAGGRGRVRNVGLKNDNSVGTDFLGSKERTTSAALLLPSNLERSSYWTRH